MRIKFNTNKNFMIKIHASSIWTAAVPRALVAAHQARAHGQIDDATLETLVHDLRTARWRRQQADGLDHVTVGELPVVDRFTALAQLFGCTAPLAVDSATTFTLNASTLLAEVDAAIALPASPKVAMLGPVSLLHLASSAEDGFDRLALLDRLLPAYERLLTLLSARGVTWVQLDEPVLGHDLPPAWQAALRHAYARLRGVDQQLLVAAGAAPLKANLDLACELPVAGLHVDTQLSSAELPALARRLPLDRELSVGLLGHGDTANALTALREIRHLRGGRLWIAAQPQVDQLEGASELGAIRRSLWRDDAALARRAVARALTAQPITPR